MEDPYHLSPLWNGLLAIYNEIARVCDKYGLRYYAADGTALGAARHGGFIPWDDDFDIFMPRPDYEEFKKLAIGELPEHLKFVCHGNTSEFKLLFGKVQDCRRSTIEAVERETGRCLSNGLFVDVFPLDGIPSTAFGRFCLRMKSMTLVQYNAFVNFKLKELPFTGKVRWWIGCMVAPLCVFLYGRKNPLVCLEDTYKSNPYDQSRLVSSYDCTLSVFRKRPLSRDVFGDGVSHAFCNQTIKVPEQCERFLENEYGDWRQLPSEDHRYPTHEYTERVPWWLGPTKK
ncbi:MAG: LicD family protein [Kiritimatiellae bacterium]|nr:LicD family protein [Kiritimatiellia bacterium]